MSRNSRAPEREGAATERRMSVGLLPKAVDDLEELQTLTGLKSQSDVINRALSVYSFVAQELAQGNHILVRNGETGEVDRVRLV